MMPGTLARRAALGFSLLTIGLLVLTPPGLPPAPAAPAGTSAVTPISAGLPDAAEPGPPKDLAGVERESPVRPEPGATPTPPPTASTDPAGSELAPKQPTAVPVQTPARIKPARSPVRPSPVASPGSTTVIRIGSWSRTLERGGQAAVNRCRAATLYYGPWPGQAPGTVWVAGHAHCGFSLWAKLGMGTRVSLTGPHGALEYVISDRVWVPRKGGSSAGLLHHDLMLQTCVGKGTSLTYATRIRPTAAGGLPR
jgi:hypothetical protein